MKEQLNRENIEFVERVRNKCFCNRWLKIFLLYKREIVPQKSFCQKTFQPSSHDVFIYTTMNYGWKVNKLPSRKLPVTFQKSFIYHI